MKSSCFLTIRRSSQCILVICVSFFHNVPIFFSDSDDAAFNFIIENCYALMSLGVSDTFVMWIDMKKFQIGLQTWWKFALFMYSWFHLKTGNSSGFSEFIELDDQNECGLKCVLGLNLKQLLCNSQNLGRINFGCYWHMKFWLGGTCALITF